MTNSEEPMICPPLHVTALAALDAMAVALAEHHHVWTDEQRKLYEDAVAACNRWSTPSPRTGCQGATGAA